MQNTLMRRALLIAGVAVLAVVWIGPLPELARGAFWAHMTMHMAVVALAAPLLALGVSGGRFDPVRRRPGPFHPIAASVVELVIVWAWHAPGLHHFARSSELGLVIEQGTFLGAGLLLWISAVGGSTSGDARGRRAAAGVLGLLLTAMHMTLLGALLALATRPLFHATAATGLTPLQDQHLGGAIMILVGGVVYLAGGLYLTVGLLRRTSSEGRATGGGAADGAGRSKARLRSDVRLSGQAVAGGEGTS